MYVTHPSYLVHVPVYMYANVCDLSPVSALPTTITLYLTRVHVVYSLELSRYVLYRRGLVF